MCWQTSPPAAREDKKVAANKSRVEEDLGSSRLSPESASPTKAKDARKPLDPTTSKWSPCFLHPVVQCCKEVDGYKVVLPWKTTSGEIRFSLHEESKPDVVLADAIYPLQRLVKRTERMQRRKRDQRLSQTLPSQSQKTEDEDPAAVEGGLGGLLFDEDQGRQHPVRVESSTFEESQTLRQTLSPAKAPHPNPHPNPHPHPHPRTPTLTLTPHSHPHPHSHPKNKK